MSPNPRWWWRYAAAGTLLTVVVWGAIASAEHSHTVAVWSTYIFGGLVWALAIWRLAGWADAEMARQTRLYIDAQVGRER